MKALGIMFVLAIVLLCVVVSMKKKNGQEEGKGRVRKFKMDPEQKKKEPVKEKPEVIAAKRSLYQYMNQGIKKMFHYYRKGNWDDLNRMGAPAGDIMTYQKEILESLPKSAADVVSDFLSCIDSVGSEEQPAGSITDLGKLKDVFESMVLPFYPVYYERLDGIRYSSLLNQTMMNLFHRLTGKKFRLGFRNRYENGVTAYRWEGEKYQVFEEDGRMLCDAVFCNGRLWEGFGILPYQDAGEADWDVIQEGYFREGVFVDGKLHYVYKKNCY